MNAAFRFAAAAAILFAGHAIAQEALPCSRVITTEDMALQRFAQGPEGRVYALPPDAIGTTELTYDYVGKSVCAKPTGKDGVTITPTQKCWDMIGKEALDDTPVIATSPTGRTIDMTPPMAVVIGEYEHHRLTCKGVKANAEMAPA